MFSIQSKDDAAEADEDEVEVKEEEWELDEVKAKATLRTLTALAVARLLWIILQVVSLALLQFFWFYSPPVTLCARRCLNLISCSPRTLLRFWCQLRSYVSPSFLSIPPRRLQSLRIARKSLWLIVVIDGRVCQLSVSLSPSCSKSLIMNNPHNGRFAFQIYTLIITIEPAVLQAKPLCVFCFKNNNF